MKTFNEFLVERTMNGDIYMSIGRAFISLDKAKKAVMNPNEESKNLATKILNDALQNLDNILGQYSFNMRSDNVDRFGGKFEDKTRQLGQIFYKFYNYFKDLVKRINSLTYSKQDVVNMLEKAKAELQPDYENALNFLGYSNQTHLHQNV